MKISQGRKEDNIHNYKLSLKIWNDLRFLIREELNKEKLVGGKYGVIDPWCLLGIQYYLMKKKDTYIKNFQRPQFYLNFYREMQLGNFNIEKKQKLIKAKSAELRIQSNVFLSDNILYDSKHIIHKKKFNQIIEKLVIKLDLKDEKILNYKFLTNYLKKRIFINLKNFLEFEDSERLSSFLINTIPELYLKSIDNLYFVGFNQILKRKPKAFIRTSSAIIDDDLKKILASFLKSNNVDLITTPHGGNNYEIAYNSHYKIDETLSTKNPRLINSTPPVGIVRYKPNNNFLKKGITIYLKEKNFQNTFLFGSETNEDHSIYMHSILELIKLTKKSIRNKLIVMRHLDTHAVNLNEFLFHIKRKQLFEMHSLKKRLYRRIFKPELQISTYTGTVFIESIFANIPCIVFINSKRYELSKEMSSLQDILINAKILHSTPESLSQFLNKNINYYKWWNSEPTKNAIDQYKNYLINLY